jgi:hypothetical protein
MKSARPRVQRDSFHHGDTKQAAVTAALALVAGDGQDAVTLRAVAESSASIIARPTGSTLRGRTCCLRWRSAASRGSRICARGHSSRGSTVRERRTGAGLRDIRDGGAASP